VCQQHTGWPGTPEATKHKIKVTVQHIGDFKADEVHTA
jgi:hypothetical protein